MINLFIICIIQEWGSTSQTGQVFCVWKIPDESSWPVTRRYNITDYYYALYSVSIFSLAKNLQLILEISATFSLV